MPDPSDPSDPSDHVLVGAIAQPDEVASAIAWLLDPAQRVVTGQTLGVDAGLGTLQPRHTG